MSSIAMDWLAGQVATENHKRSRIELEYPLTQRQFDELPEYSCSLPTLTVIDGRFYGVTLWKRNMNAYRSGVWPKDWWVAEIIPRPEREEQDITWYRPVILDSAARL